MFHCMSAKDVNINIHNFTYKYWINFLLFWFGSNMRLPNFKRTAPAVLQANKCHKRKQIPSNVFSPHFAPQLFLPQKQLNPIHFNCILNNKTTHNPVYEIWTLGGAEGLGGVKSTEKWKIRGDMLTGKNLFKSGSVFFLWCFFLFVYLFFTSNDKVFPLKRCLWFQKIEHTKDKDDQAKNQETWV